MAFVRIKRIHKHIRKLTQHSDAVANQIKSGDC